MRSVLKKNTKSRRPLKTVLETGCTGEKERGLAGQAAGERAARWLDSHVSLSEWTTKEMRCQEKGHDLEVKDLRVDRRHWSSQGLSPRKEGETCFPKTGGKEERLYPLHMYLLSTYYFPDYSRHGGCQCTNQMLILVKLLFWLNGRGGEIRKAIEKYEAVEDETWWTVLLVQGMMIWSSGVRWAGLKDVEGSGLAPEKPGEQTRDEERCSTSCRAHEPLTQEMVSRVHLLWRCGYCAAWEPWLGMEEGRCPELGTGKASAVKGYRALGLQIPRWRHKHLKTTECKWSRSQHTHQLVGSVW